MSKGNYMQRIFDALRSASDFMTVAELTALTGIDDMAVRHALERLNRDRKLVSVCQERQWRYGVKKSAERPVERGGRRPGAGRKRTFGRD